MGKEYVLSCVSAAIIFYYFFTLCRYGENVIEVNKNQSWICPVCRGICNCSCCRLSKGWKPTGSIYRKVKHIFLQYFECLFYCMTCPSVFLGIFHILKHIRYIFIERGGEGSNHDLCPCRRGTSHGTGLSTETPPYPPNTIV